LGLLLRSRCTMVAATCKRPEKRSYMQRREELSRWDLGA
jgi:hypothetical protein